MDGIISTAGNNGKGNETGAQEIGGVDEAGDNGPATKRKRADLINLKTMERAKQWSQTSTVVSASG